MVQVALFRRRATYAEIELLKDSSLASTIGVFEYTYYASTQGVERRPERVITTPFFVAGVSTTSP